MLLFWTSPVGTKCATGAVIQCKHAINRITITYLMAFMITDTKEVIKKKKIILLEITLQTDDITCMKSLRVVVTTYWT